MKKSAILLLAAAVAASLGSCNSNAGDELSQHHHHHHGEEAEAHDAHDHEHEVGHDHGHEGEDAQAPELESKHAGGPHSDEIILKPEMAERFGVETAKVTPAPFRQALKVSGRIINGSQGAAVVSAPTSGIVSIPASINAGSSVRAGQTVATVNPGAVSGGNPDKAAKIALDAAKRELDRITPLYKDRIVTTRDYNAALQTYESAKAAYSATAASGRATAPVSGVITSLDVDRGQYVEAGATIATVADTRRVTLRADVPQRFFSFVPAVTTANIVLPYSGMTLSIADLHGTRLSSTPAGSDNVPGYIPVYFTFDNDGSVISGTGVEVYLLGDERQGVISVPLSALSEQQGNLYVYVRLDEEGYEKRLVLTGARDGSRVEITDGLHDGDEVVTKGAVTVRLAESSGVIPEGHSHNH